MKHPSDPRRLKPTGKRLRSLVNHQYTSEHSSDGPVRRIVRNKALDALMCFAGRAVALGGSHYV